MQAMIFDSETTGKADPEIVEVAWREVTFGNPTILEAAGCEQRFQPSKEIELGATATHGILAEDLIGCDPSASFEPPDVSYWIGQNCDFDWIAAGSPPEPKRIDTCALARACWPDLDCYSQTALIYFLDRRNARQRVQGAHGAAADIMLCKSILDAEIAATGVQSWEELWQRSEEARIPKRMPFGKHQNMPIEDLPRDYIAWLLRCTDPPIDEYLRIAITGGRPVQRALFCPQ